MNKLCVIFGKRFFIYNFFNFFLFNKFMEVVCMRKDTMNFFIIIFWRGCCFLDEMWIKKKQSRQSMSGVGWKLLITFLLFLGFHYFLRYCVDGFFFVLFSFLTTFRNFLIFLMTIITQFTVVKSNSRKNPSNYPSIRLGAANYGSNLA